MGERFKEFWLGVFIIVSIAVIAWFLLFLHPSVGDGDTTLRVRFTNIQGISKGTRVTFAGKPVGDVMKIEQIHEGRTDLPETDGNIYFYELLLRVDSSVHVYNYDEIMFSTSGLLGEKSIAILPKSPCPGQPPAYEVTNDILCAKSTDKLEETLEEILDVASSFEGAMTKLENLIDDNKEKIHEATTSFAAASEEVRKLVATANENDLATKLSDAAGKVSDAAGKADKLITQAIDSDLVNRIAKTLEEIRKISAKIASGEGTMGKLIYSDSLYLQLTSTMNHLETTFSDINHYGLLFQYDKGWQRTRTAKMNRMHKLCTPCDFYTYFNDELTQITTSLDRVSRALESAECKEMPIQDDCFSQRFRELLGRVENLEQELKLYSQKLMEQYSEKCHCN